jgi:hypothetical protein
VLRQVFIVHWVYIVLVLLGFGTLCFLFAPELASGHPLARFLTASMAVFWCSRGLLQLFVYDRNTRRAHTRADMAFLLACAFLTGVFLLAARG